MSAVSNNGTGEALLHTWPQREGQVESYRNREGEIFFHLRCTNGTLVPVREVVSPLALSHLHTKVIQQLFSQTYCRMVQQSDSSYKLYLNIRVVGGMFEEDNEGPGESSSPSQSTLTAQIFEQMRQMQEQFAADKKRTETEMSSLRERVQQTECKNKQLEEELKKTKEARASTPQMPKDEARELSGRLGIDFARDTDSAIARVIARAMPRDTYSSVLVRTASKDPGNNEGIKRYRIVELKLTGGQKFCSFFKGLFGAMGWNKNVSCYLSNRYVNGSMMALLGSKDPEDIEELRNSFNRGDDLTIYFNADPSEVSVFAGAKSVVSVGEKIYKVGEIISAVFNS